jgi:Rho-binding antiterminator
MMTDYTPIDCGLYSEYELAILHRKRLRILWQEPNGKAHLELLEPKDLKTRNHEEFLIAENMKGQRLELRLDHIRKAEAV